MKSHRSYFCIIDLFCREVASPYKGPVMPSFNVFFIVHLGHELKWKCHHFDEIIIGCTESCQNDNFQCSQWSKFHQNDNISVSVWSDQTVYWQRNEIITSHMVLAVMLPDCDRGAYVSTGVGPGRVLGGKGMTLPTLCLIRKISYLRQRSVNVRKHSW